jgi:hypothetical protein
MLMLKIAAGRRRDLVNMFGVVGLPVGWELGGCENEDCKFDDVDYVDEQ